MPYGHGVPIEIRRVTAAETAPLRQRVLRPHQSVEELARPMGGDEKAIHFAAVDTDQIIATASVRPEAPPWAPDHRPSWRLRGMATDERYRGQGIGTALLGAVVDHVHREGGGLLWCTARTPAVAFYRRAGLVTRGESWVDPVIGPHIAMAMVVGGTAP
jgi:GNAT superfamily N-acetyltransferase